MRIVLDMNVSPTWEGYLASFGHEAVHWTRVGDARSKDDEIMLWAEQNGHIIMTHDLDFGASLALNDVAGPSVLLLRLDGTLPSDIGDAIVTILVEAKEELETGALVVLDESHARVRRLPFGIASDGLEMSEW